MQRGFCRLRLVAFANQKRNYEAIRVMFMSSVPLSAKEPEHKSRARKPGRVSSPRKANPGAARHRISCAQLVGDIEALLHEARCQGGTFERSVDYLRRVSAVLQQCKSREECTAAVPLCHLVNQGPTSDGKAAMESVRIYQKAGRYDEAVLLAEKLMSENVFVLDAALVSAIKACAALGHTDQGFRIFDAAVTRGSIPNLPLYSALLAVAGATGDPQRVQSVLTQMKEAGFEMNELVFHDLMSAYVRGGYVTKALALFDTMQKQGIPADGHTFAILMDAHVASGDFDGAMALMNELKQTTIEPNLVHYNILLKFCGKVSNLTTAFQLYEELKERKIKPDQETFINMMYAVYHGEIGAIDHKQVKATLTGVGLLGLACVSFINYHEYMMTTLLWGSLVGSMGLAAYMNPDGVIRSLYPNTDEARDDTVIEAFFRRLREEDHCGRSMYLWREMVKFNVQADPRVYNALARICVRKRHPELAYEVVFEEKRPLVDNDGLFVLTLLSTVNLLHSLLAQRRLNMADTLYDAARSHSVFKKIFFEKHDVFVYDLRSFLTEQVRSYTIIKLIDELRAKVDSSNGKFIAPNVLFLVHQGYKVLDRLDTDNASLRTLFSMDDMTRIRVEEHSSSSHYYFRLAVSSARLQNYFKTTPANAGKEQRL